MKAFGDFVAVNGINLEIPRGSFVTFLGPSGCGKTTTLRLIGGFEHPDSGEIAIRGKPMGQTPPHARDTSMVFQSYALFPHMSVRENIAFGLQERKVGVSEIQDRVERILNRLELQLLGDRRPRELSGGQQQRVALARSLVIEPAVLLLDEPLGALDLRLRKQMQIELKRLQQQVGITFIHVTHDQEEAITMSDRIVVMRSGRVEQEGSPEEIFNQPSSRYVAEFMGAGNVLPVVVASSDSSHTAVQFAGRHIVIPSRCPDRYSDYVLVIRPEKVRLDAEDGWQGTVVEQLYKGSAMSYQVQLLDGTMLVVEVAHENARHRHTIGDQVLINFRASDATLVPGTRGAD